MKEYAATNESESEHGLDTLVARLLVGDATAEDPTVARQLDEHAELRAEWNELTELAARLEGASDEQNDTLYAAEIDPETPGADRVASVLTSLAEGRTPAPVVTRAARRASLPNRLIGIAAAILITLSFVWQVASDWNGPPSRQGDVYLGQSELELTSPRGPIRAWASFRWKGPRVIGGWYSLEIWDNTLPQSVTADGATPTEALGDDAVPIVRLTHLTETEWTPSNELPASLRLRLRQYDTGGEVLDQIDEELSLSR